MPFYVGEGVGVQVGKGVSVGVGVGLWRPVETIIPAMLSPMLMTTSMLTIQKITRLRFF